MNIRSQVIDVIASLVSSEGTLLIVTRLRETKETSEEPPWLVYEVELSQL